jgi:5-methylcytosine-specific restriction endonuclease McrA
MSTEAYRRWLEKPGNREKERERKRLWKKNNKEKVAAQARRRRAEIPDESRQKKREWRDRNKDAVNAQQTQWRKNNPEKTKEYGQRRYWDNREEYLAKQRERAATRENWRWHRARGHMRNVVGRYPNSTVGDGSENPELLELWMFTAFECGCKYCGSKDDMHVDHIVPLSRGGEHRWENLQPLCRRCNIGKNDMLEDEFYAWVSSIKESK